MLVMRRVIGFQGWSFASRFRMRIRFAVSFVADDVGESDRGGMKDRIM